MHGSPSSLDARYRNGNALRTAGEFEAAEVELRGVLAQAPQHRDAAYSLAFMLREQGRTEAATAAIAAWWQAARPDAESSLAAVGFLIECANYTLALGIARRARTLWPGDARLAAKLGESALALGHFDEAGEALRAAVDAAPRLGNTWLRLAYCRRFAERDDADLARFRRAWSDPTLDTTARLCAGFALGKAFDDLGEWAAAVDVLRPANRTAHAAAGWNPRAWQHFVDARLASGPPPAQPVTEGFTPVFVVGLPRTGTTLVAAGLARRRGVHDRGELNWVSGLYSHLQEHGQLGNARALATTAAMIRAQMRRDDAPARFYIDKNPLNFRYLDFIVALFPNARIVHCRRSARDTALSIWMQHFAHEDLGFSYAFADIAAVEVACATLMQHWRTRGIAIHAIDYEELVAAPADRMDALAAALGMEREDTGELATEAVATASVWQVRQPVYASSVERWRRYAPYLPELETLFDA